MGPNLAITVDLAAASPVEPPNAMMSVGIDAQVVLDGNRSGLYTHLRCLVPELRTVLDDRLVLLAESTAGRSQRAADATGLSVAMGGAAVNLIARPKYFYNAWYRLSAINRVDVMLHNLHGRLPLARTGANAFLVPDLIPLALEYADGVSDDYRRFYESAITHGDVIIVWSEHTKRDLLTRVGGRADLIRVVPLAAGPEFRPVDDPAVLKQSLTSCGLAAVPYVLMVATIETRKNHVLLLEAFARLLQRRPALPHKLVLAGARWLGHERVFEAIDRLGLHERVVYLGFVDNLPLLYAGAAAFVFPSLYEGFGLPPLEAMAAGVPVLAANATSLPEVVGDAGLLFDPADDDGLSQALERVLTNPALRAELAAKGRDRAAAFTWRRSAELYRDAFEFGRMQRRERRRRA